MASSRFALPSLATLALALVAGGASAQVYKCQDAQGKTSYQQKPCDAPGAKSTTMVEPPPRATEVSPPPKAPDAAPAAAPSSNAAPAGTFGSHLSLPPRKPDPPNEPAEPASPPKYTRETVFMVTAVAACRDMPGFGTRIAPNYARWRSVHLDAVADFERTPDYARLVNEAKAAPRDDARERQCRDLEKELALEWGPADPRLATPEMTWRTFTTALRGGDRKVVADTVIGTQMDQIVQDDFAQMRTKLLPSVNGAKLTRVEKSGNDSQIGYFTKPKGGEGRVGFERAGTNWRIAEVTP